MLKVTYLFFGVENFGSLGRLLLLGLDSVEERVAQVLWHVDLAQVELGASGDHVDLVDAS